jgi:hypothetical protein
MKPKIKKEDWFISAFVFLLTAALVLAVYKNTPVYTVFFADGTTKDISCAVLDIYTESIKCDMVIYNDVMNVEVR